MANHNCLRRRELAQRLNAFFPSVTGMFEAAKRKLDAAAGSIGVDEHLARAHLTSHPEGSAAVTRPYARGEAVVRIVG